MFTFSVYLQKIVFCTVYILCLAVYTSTSTVGRFVKAIRCIE